MKRSHPGSKKGLRSTGTSRSASDAASVPGRCRFEIGDQILAESPPCGSWEGNARRMSPGKRAAARDDFDRDTTVDQPVDQFVSGGAELLGAHGKEPRAHTDFRGPSDQVGGEISAAAIRALRLVKRCGRHHGKSGSPVSSGTMSPHHTTSNSSVPPQVAATTKYAASSIRLLPSTTCRGHRRQRQDTHHADRRETDRPHTAADSSFEPRRGGSLGAIPTRCAVEYSPPTGVLIRVVEAVTCPVALIGTGPKANAISLVPYASHRTSIRLRFSLRCLLDKVTQTVIV